MCPSIILQYMCIVQFACWHSSDAGFLLGSSGLIEFVLKSSKTSKCILLTSSALIVTNARPSLLVYYAALFLSLCWKLSCPEIQQFEYIW